MKEEDEETCLEIVLGNSSPSASSNYKMNCILVQECSRLQLDEDDEDDIIDRRREDSLRDTLRGSRYHLSPKLMPES